MNSNLFTSVNGLEELGETIACVYFTCEYDYNKAVQYLKWKGLVTSYGYTYNGFMIFYQKKEYVPNLTVEDEFYRVVGEDVMWENMPSGIKYDYRYRLMSTGVVCVSFISSLT